jgi:hypothetical protein
LGVKSSWTVTRFIDADGATPMAVEVRGAERARGEIGQLEVDAAPEVAHGVAVAAVPLAPAGREVAERVTAGPVSQGSAISLTFDSKGVLPDGVEEASERVEVARRAAEAGGEVETEPVDVHLRDLITQRVGDEPEPVWSMRVLRVADAGVVDVTAVIVEAVVRRFVESAQAQRRSMLVALGRVVVDDVQDHRDPGRVQCPDHRLEVLDAPVLVVGAK